MTLPKEFTTVTPFSKTVALILFISLPLLGFFLGMRYREVQKQTQTPVTLTTITPSVIPIQDDNKDMCNNDSDCQLVMNGDWSKCNYSGACQPIDYSLKKWIAVNSAWFNKTLHKNCPDIDKIGAPQCFPKPINDNYTAKCFNHLCNKISKP